MRALLQRVTHAQVTVDGEVVGSCGRGFLVLLGVGPDDDEASCERLWKKVRGMRVFDDEAGKMNLALGDMGGELLVVSQFTLYADCRRGNRPSFTGAAEPALANRLYERFCELAERDVAHVGRGVFAAEMQVELVNDGPITIWLDTDELGRGGKA
ncbi:MAG: D-tyrosyl-tRNA(Tyr) deacylase [Atopobiaceae bacterium]|nr:D-tyrosyl-tRNA(Tyr) deacylase [Atopobiaceae bacterium]